MGLHGGVAKAVSALGFNPDCCTDVAAVNMLAMLRACVLITSGCDTQLYIVVQSLCQTGYCMSHDAASACTHSCFAAIRQQLVA